MINKSEKSENQRQFLIRVKNIQTRIGKVAILSFDEEIPLGWERLTMKEGLTQLQSLKKILTMWSIVAFQYGALRGPGYDYKIDQTYGVSCGEGFILKRNA